MKFLVLIGDGMADWLIEARDGKTPLELAKTNNMDWIASNGELRLVKTVPEECHPGSEVANMAIMGYNPATDLPGRGPLEALSANVPMSETDIAFRCNVITIEDERIKDYSAGHISTEEAKELIHAVQKELGQNGVDFFPGIQYRHILRLDGKKFSDQVICTPPHDQLGQLYEPFLIKPKDNSEESKKTADFLNSLILKSNKILEKHPINQARKAAGKNMATHVWFWSGGKRPAIPTFQKKFGKTGAVISAVDLIFGIGIAAGLDAIHVEGATGLLDSNFEGKIQSALQALETKDFVYVHVEAPDEMGHAGDIDRKILAIEEFDRRIVGPAIRSIEKFPEGLAIAVLPDHPTPIKIKTHARDLVPVAIYSTTMKKEMSKTKISIKYTEANARLQKYSAFQTGEEFLRYFFRCGEK
jgi:2,3-bisphosphoglycerate-independent phosphoglycerate mutase